MSSLIPRKFSSQLSIIFIGLLIITLASYGWFFSKQQTDILVINTQQRISVLARNLAIACEPYIIVNDLSAIEHLVFRFAEYPYINQVMVVDHEGRILSKVRRTNNDEMELIYSAEIIEIPTHPEIETITGINNITIWHPIIINTLQGWVMVNIGLDETTQLKQQVWKNTLFVGGVISIGSLILIPLLIRSHSRLLSDATNFAANLDKYRGQQLNVAHNTLEFEELGNALNRTSEKLLQQEREIESKHQELLNHQKNLQQQVAERTAELRNSQAELVKKERLAVLGQLTATVSHELRNPLATISSSAYIIQKKSENNNTILHKASLRIQRNIHRCDHIIDDMLDYTRLSDLTMHPSELDEWLTSLLDELPVPDGLTRDCSLGLPGLTPSFDQDRLRRVIINLYDNAIQAMQDVLVNDQFVDGANLGIITRYHDERKEIIISDNGSGIPEGVIGRVFEPLFSTKGFGVGLGLPIVQQIMKQHMGGIEIDTKEGRGTRVTVWLPSQPEYSA